jgi:hypothetical protein
MRSTQSDIIEWEKKLAGQNLSMKRGTRNLLSYVGDVEQINPASTHKKTKSGRRSPVTRNYRKTCEFCEEKFLGVKHAKYCDRCKAPQFAAICKRLR